MNSPQPASESPTESPPASEAQQPRDADGKFRPKGMPEDETWEFVDLSPDAQKRFNRIYGALKHNQNLNEQLLKDNVTLAARLEALEKNVFESEGQRTEAQLKAQKVSALANQDYERVAEIDDQLMEMRIAARTPTQPVVSDTPVAQQYELDEESKTILDGWGSERDGSGNLLRPWVDPKHPLHEKAARAHQVIMADPMTSFAPLPDVLDQIDRLMGVEKSKSRPSPAAKPARQAAAVGVDIPPKRSGSQPQLTAQEIYIAKKMFRGDPDPITRYRRAVATHR